MAAPPLIRLGSGPGVWKLQYKGPSNPAFVDVPSGNLYVLKNTVVQFKLVSTKATDNFGAATWSGGGGGATKNVTFNLESTNSTAVQAVTATMGASRLTANVIVYGLQGTLTPEDNFAGRSLSNLGVDERVSLDCTVTPAGVTMGNIGGVDWGIEGAGAVDRKNNGLIANSGRHDGKANYTAPWATRDLNPKAVTLTLKVQGGPSAGTGVNLAITVHSPTAIMSLDPAKPTLHEGGKPSAGFFGLIYLRPMNVSFRTLEWREAGGRSVAKAVGGAAPSGYFAFDHNKVHQPTTQTAGTTMRVLGGDSALGCKIDQVDKVWSGWTATYPGAAPTGPTNVASEIVWPIYWQYRVAGLAGAEWIRFQVAEHKAVMSATGSVTISKATASTTKALNDATSWVA